MLINKKLLKLTKGSRWAIALCSFSELIMQSLMVLTALFVARAVADLGTPQFMHSIAVPFVLMIVTVPFRILRTILSANSDNIFISRTRISLAEKLTDAGMPAVIGERTGVLTTTIINKVQALAPYYSAYLPALMGVLVVSTGSIIYISSISMPTAALSFFSLLMVLVIPYFWYNKMHIKGVAGWKAMAEFRADFLDNIQGMETLKMLKGQEMKKDQLSDRFRDITKTQMGSIYVNSVESALLVFFAGLGSTVSSGLAAVLAMRGDISPMHLVEILLVSHMAFVPVYALLNAWHLGFSGVTASGSVFEMLNLERDRWTSDAAEKNEAAKDFVTDVPVAGTAGGGLIMRNINFSYDERRQILKDVCLDAKKGEVVAIVGESGSGKSTIISLLAGLYPLKSGEISMDGVQLNDQSYLDWRRNVSVVWQNPYIFHASLRDNITLGSPDAADSDIIAAIDAAGLSDLYKQLPQGLDTMMGEKGSGLSGGERQRVAIARCFLKDSDILIFDEATSSLDEENQNFITEKIGELFKGRTTVLISHRLSTIRHADRIYMLEDGVITDVGTHAQLLEKSSRYRSLARFQEA